MRNGVSLWRRGAGFLKENVDVQGEQRCHEYASVELSSVKGGP